jgi:outer membrane protein assembly factor BamA
LELKKIYFQNNSLLKSDFLYKNLGIYIDKAWYEFYKDTAPKADRFFIDSLKDSIVNLYKNEGFYHVSVTSIDDNGSITFKIDEKSPLLVESIDITSDISIENIINFQEGDRFVFSKFIDIKKEIRESINKRGFCRHILDAKAFIDTKKNSVNLIYNIKKQNRCRFGLTRVFLDKNIDKNIVYSRLYFKDGDYYSTNKLLSSYENLLGLEIFKQIKISEMRDGDTIDHNITLKLKDKMISRDLGIGYDTDYGVKATFGWEHKNFYTGANKLSFDFKYSQDEQVITNSFFYPAFLKIKKFDSYFDLKNELSYMEVHYGKFDEKKFVNKTYLQRYFNRFSFNFGIDYEKINIKRRANLCGIEDGDFIILAPFLQMIYDGRDSKIDPKNGIYLSSYIESGTKYLASSSSYSKLIFRGTFIKSFFDLTIAARGKIGYIDEFENTLPESKLFFAGGSFSNRAYGYKRLSATDSNCDNLGAKSLVDNSLEISYPLVDSISFALFWDATMVSREINYFNLDFKHSYGGGIRYKSPIGPIKFDVGFDRDDNSIYSFHFQIGQSY